MDVAPFSPTLPSPGSTFPGTKIPYCASVEMVSGSCLFVGKVPSLLLPVLCCHQQLYFHLYRGQLWITLLVISVTQYMHNSLSTVYVPCKKSLWVLEQLFKAWCSLVREFSGLRFLMFHVHPCFWCSLFTSTWENWTITKALKTWKYFQWQRISVSMPRIVILLQHADILTLYL